MITITTLLRLADDSTAPITITRAAGECTWGVVPQGYIGRRCTQCALPLFKCGLCEYHFDIWRKTGRDIRHADRD